jgi:hypothetical protein
MVRRRAVRNVMKATEVGDLKMSLAAPQSHDGLHRRARTRLRASIERPSDAALAPLLAVLLYIDGVVDPGAGIARHEMPEL